MVSFNLICSGVEKIRTSTHTLATTFLEYVDTVLDAFRSSAGAVSPHHSCDVGFSCRHLRELYRRAQELHGGKLLVSKKERDRVEVSCPGLIFLHICVM